MGAFMMRHSFITLTHWICSVVSKAEPVRSARILRKLSTIAPTKLCAEREREARAERHTHTPRA